MTEYHGRHNTAATKGIKMARWVGLIYLFLGSLKTPKSKVLKSTTFEPLFSNCNMTILGDFERQERVNYYEIIISRMNIDQELTTPYGNMPTSAIRLGERHMLAVA